MKVLVTGATGFVGQTLVGHLLQNGNEVTTCVREFSSYLPEEVNQVVTGDLATMADPRYDATGDRGDGRFGLDSSASLGMTSSGPGVTSSGPGMTSSGLDSRLHGNGSVNDYDLALRGAEVVVHTAARVHVMNDKASDPLAEFRLVNTDATLNLARQAALAGVKRFIFISTIKVNGEFTTPIPSFPRQGRRSSRHKAFSQKEGKSIDKPTVILSPSTLFRTGSVNGAGDHKHPSTPAPLMGEGKSKPFNEAGIPNPQDPYAISKWEAEQGLMQIAKETGMEVVIIRPPLIYGPGVKGNFASMMKWVGKGIPLPFGAVRNQRSLLALDNLVSFIIHCLDHPKAANEVFLLSDGEDVSTAELIRKLAVVQGKNARLSPVPVSWMKFAARLLGKQDVADRLFGSLQVDSSKAREFLGWQPIVSIDEQLKKMVEYETPRPRS